jgi:hypothetical protein
MTKYLILYRSLMSAADQMGATTPEEREAVMGQWMAWGAEAGEALVDFGQPTMPTSDADPGPAGWIGGYSIMQAADLDTLARILASHPHTAMGGTIEVLEMLQMPGM